MSEDLQSQRYYVLERIGELREQIPQAMQAMVVFRARIEKYRQTDMSAARDTYDALRRVRDDLTQALADVQPLLMELESYALATMAGQLLRGFKGFDLMSTGYRPVYDAVCRFAQQLPEKNTVNAATIGRLMNNVKLGYYPTDPDSIALMLQGISFPEGMTTNVFDPCCGCGKALRQIAQGNNCYAYGVELDESRAEEAQTRLHRVGFGSFFHSDISREAFHLLFLNPPYLSVLNESGSKARHEKRFLIESIPHLLYGGLLLYVMLSRHIGRATVQAVLSSPTNQLIETQSPSTTPGKEHDDERALISDPTFEDAIIIVLVILFYPIPEIRVITVERVMDHKWEKHINENPWLVRKV